jgi:hypothetical protein
VIGARLALALTVDGGAVIIRPAILLNRINARPRQQQLNTAARLLNRLNAVPRRLETHLR